MMEPDILYFRRRACEEMSAASRAVTPAAKERRLQLVGVYLERLKALKAPIPFDDRRLEHIRNGHSRSAFAWSSQDGNSDRA